MESWKKGKGKGNFANWHYNWFKVVTIRPSPLAITILDVITIKKTVVAAALTADLGLAVARIHERHQKVDC